MNSKYNITAIVAVTPTGGVSDNNKMPWDFPEDLEWFKQNTIDKTCIVSKTLYMKLKNLPNRRFIVISSNPGETSQLEYNYNHYSVKQIAEDLQTDVMVIGGPKVYEWATPDLTGTYLTIVKGDYYCNQFVDIEAMTTGMRLTDNSVCPELEYQLWSKH